MRQKRTLTRIRRPDCRTRSPAAESWHLEREELNWSYYERYERRFPRVTIPLSLASAPVVG